jgi:hypothetical protein
MEVHLDLIAPEDEAILAQDGLTALRQARILRLSSGAAAQGAVLTYDDLVHLLSTSLSTVQRDVRSLQKAGFAVPVHRRRGRRAAGVLLVPFLLMMWFAPSAQAQLSSIFGDVGFEYEFENQKSEATSATRHLFRQQYNLGAEGRILDPRLATFSVFTGFNSSLLTDENERGTLFGGSFSLLQGKPYGLLLRGSKNFSQSGSDIDSTSVGALFRLTYPEWPQFFLELDRIGFESRGDTRLDNAITTGRMRFSHRFWNTMADGEVGLQNSSDDLRNNSIDRYFARFNSQMNWSPTTTLRTVNDAFLEGNELVMSSSYAIENVPDATLRRNAMLAYRSHKVADEQDSSLSLTGSLSKTFLPRPWLQANTFTSALGQKGFGADATTGAAWSGGTNTAISYFRPVTLLSDYALAVSYRTDLGEPTMTQQMHFGAISRTLEPLRLAGDYFLGLQNGGLDSTRHFIGGKADLAVTPQFLIRSFAEFLTETVRSSEPDESSGDRSTVNVGAGISYRPLYNLFVDLAGNVEWKKEHDISGLTMRGNVHLGYVIPVNGSPTLDLDGIWDDSTANEQSRLQFRTRLSYSLGRTVMSVEHRLERNALAGSGTLTNTIRLNFTRHFRFGR